MTAVSPSLAKTFLAEIAADPEAVQELRQLVWPVESGTPEVDDGWLDSKGAAAYIGLSVTALHKHTSAREIPFHQRVPGGKCWFKRSELDAWRRGA